MKKVRLVSIGLCAVMALGILSGCGKNDDKAADKLSGTVNTNGSTSMEKVMQILSESFEAKEKDVTVNYSGTGSGTGIQAIIDGTCDIGLSSRELKAEESGKGARAYTIALDGVAIIVNPANTVTDLTVDDIARLATGEISNWKELGGADSPVAFIGREAGSGTRSAFEELLKVQDKCAYTNELTSTGDVVANVSSNPNAFGYVSMASVGANVKAVKVGGVVCSEATILDGTYVIQRPFVLVLKDGVTLSPAAQAFVDFALSSEAAPLIKQAGAVPPVK